MVMNAAPVLRKPEMALARTTTGARNPVHDIVSVGLDGGDPKSLIGQSSLPSGKPALDAAPAWSPDGKRMAFTIQHGQRGFEGDIYIANADGSHPRAVTHDGRSGEPAWSPDGTTIVFSRVTLIKQSPVELAPGSRPPPAQLVPTGSSLWEMNVDGSEARPLLSEEAGTFDGNPVFSPSGAQIAFVRATYQEESGLATSDIYVLDSDGGDLEMLAGEANEPAYSQDGTRIAFSSERDKNGDYRFGSDEVGPASELYVMSSDGSDVERLTETLDLNEVSPTWSSDGALIAFERQSDSFNKAVFIINSDGSCPIEVLGDPHGNTWYGGPAWRPGSRPGDRDC